MDKNKKVIMIDLGGNTVTAFGWKNGVSLGTTVFRVEDGVSRWELEKRVLARFSSQYITSGGASGVVTPREKWDVKWFDVNKILELDNSGELFPQVAQPVKQPSGKPKIYEVVDDGNGLRLITHERELLDEDEAKLALFAKAVNGGK